MPDRCSEKDATTAFEQLCVAMGKRIACDARDVGAWKLETVWPWGHRILEVTTSRQMGGEVGYGENPILFTNTRTNRELYTLCHDAMRVLEVYDPQTQHDRFAVYYRAQHEAALKRKARR